MVTKNENSMKIEYIVSEEMHEMGYNDEQGRPLYATDFVIVDQDRIVDGKPFVLDDWQAIYHLDDKQYEIDQQVDCAEFIVNKLKKYIHAFKLHSTLLKATKEEKYKNSGIEESKIDEDTAKFNEMQAELDNLSDELTTIRCALAFHKKTFDTVDENWISENMTNDCYYVMGREHLIEMAEELAI